MMNAKKLGLCVLTAAVLLCGCGKKNDVVTETDAFSCKVDECRIVTDEDGDRGLHITYSIHNESSQDYKNVSFESFLNEEADTFFNHQAGTYKSDEYHVLGKGKEVDQNDPKQTNGFTHFEEIDEPDGKNLDDVEDKLKSLTIRIQWDGGKQEVELPLTLEESTEKITEEITE